MPWRAEDEALLSRLEDEELAEQLFALFLGRREKLHARSGGLIAELRKVDPAAVTAALGGDIVPLGRLVTAIPDRTKPALVHHVALIWARTAAALEGAHPEAAAAAWTRSLVAWFVLAEEKTYLEALMTAVMPRDTPSAQHGPMEQLRDIARRADASARDLDPPGKAALLALYQAADAARTAGASKETIEATQVFATRRRNEAIETALSVIAEGIDEASIRGELIIAGRTLLLRAVTVWSWTTQDEAVEQFVVDRIDKIGWELYRGRHWDALRYLLDPFRPMLDSLATRIERDPSQIAHAAGCAQMFVFMAEVEKNALVKRELAERALRICPPHRNGRLVLAAFLCDEAMQIMKNMVIVTRKDEIARAEAILARAESLYPRSRDLPDAKAMLERVKKVKLAM